MSSVDVQDELYWINRQLSDDKRDWKVGDKNWVMDYRGSSDHPHRQLIIDALKKIKLKSLLEIGCNAGPNLIRINNEFPGVKLAGFDANAYSIEAAKEILNADLKVGLATEAPFEEQFDVVLADAVLMYVPDLKVYRVMNEIDRLTKKAVIIVDWFDEAELGVIRDFHWARNYPKLLEDLGFRVEKIKLTEQTWPSPAWVKHGYVFVCHRQSQTSEKN